MTTPEEEQLATNLPSGLKLMHEINFRKLPRFQIASLFCVSRFHSSSVPSSYDAAFPDEYLPINLQNITKNLLSGLIANVSGRANNSVGGPPELNLKLE